MFSVVENSKNLIKTFKQKRRKFKKNKFKKLLTLSNIHINFYLVNMIREYKIIMNLSVFIKKLKHKYNIFLNVYSINN